MRPWIRPTRPRWPFEHRGCARAVTQFATACSRWTGTSSSRASISRSGRPPRPRASRNERIRHRPPRRASGRRARSRRDLRAESPRGTKRQAHGARLARQAQAHHARTRRFRPSLWLGALPPLALLCAAASGEAGADARPFAVLAARRFSAWALVVMLAIIATGIWNTWNEAGDPGSLLGTRYGHLVLLKSALLAPV